MLDKVKKVKEDEKLLGHGENHKKACSFIVRVFVYCSQSSFPTSMSIVAEVRTEEKMAIDTMIA